MELVVVADQQRCRVLSAQRDRNGGLSLSELAAMEVEFVSSEHGRPSPLGGKDGHSYASHHDERGEQLQEAARQIVAFLKNGVRMPDPTPTKVRVLAPARLMGALRKKLPGTMPVEVAEHVGEFTKLSPHDLAHHQVARDFCTR